MNSRLILLACWLSAAAQSPIAPTPGDTGPGPGQNSGDYNVVQSWELGYRFHTVGGNVGAYRSMANYRNGMRLLGSSLSVNSREGHGRWFDEIVLNTQGLGNDPYQSATFRVQKNGLFDYNLLWRQNDYYNPNLVLSSGDHFRDTQRRWQDHDLTLFPQSRLRLHLGYGRTVETGPAFLTEQVAESTNNPPLLFTDLRRQLNSYSIGGEARLSIFTFTIQRRWDAFKEDANYQSATEGPFGNVNQTNVSNFRSTEPHHGTTPTWVGHIFADQKAIRVNGRATYSGGRRSSILDERFNGGLPGPANRLNQVIVFGNARRPALTADLGLTAFATKKLTVVANTSYADIRIDGNETFVQFNNATPQFSRANFQFLGLRRFTTALDLRYAFLPALSGYVGYQYSQREIRSVESIAPIGGPLNGVLARNSNHLNAATAGLNWSPWKSFNVKLQGEVGRSSNPFTPVAERDYQAFDGRLRYTTKRFRWSAAYRENYNNNSISVTSYSSRSRNYSTAATWTGTSWMSVDGDYSKLHVDTAGGIAFFAGNPRPVLNTGNVSIYVSNLHGANLGIRLNWREHVELYMGENITHDAGDGRATNVGTGTAIDSIFYAVQTFPLTYHSPSARLSMRVSEKLRFSAGYQYYGYHEHFGLLDVQQNFRANTGYVGMMFSF